MKQLLDRAANSEVNQVLRAISVPASKPTTLLTKCGKKHCRHVLCALAAQLKADWSAIKRLARSVR